MTAYTSAQRTACFSGRRLPNWTTASSVARRGGNIRKKVLAYESVATFSAGAEAAEIVLFKENSGEDAVAQVKENA